MLPTDEGWAKSNRHYRSRDFGGYLEFFFDRCYPEPHSTKQREDTVAWGLEVLGYVHGLAQHLAACDVAVVQGHTMTDIGSPSELRPRWAFTLPRGGH
ncbi:MAG: hypothetical protein M3370_08890 [Actinomycetota bacterium]|nr:hypothetical protein [Actinomycetota bacterium]